ncbi:MAG: hypothetical protein DRI46_09610 [Chloroflexi bacterium]|nr:MAG: hypothetical protein DRI46_09610 [Chloroflexota bacterium]
MTNTQIASVFEQNVNSRTLNALHGNNVRLDAFPFLVVSSSVGYGITQQQVIPNKGLLFRSDNTVANMPNGSINDWTVQSGHMNRWDALDAMNLTGGELV